ncbi:MAG: NAD(P)/FAD-dependent oxidoreductase [Chloroflexi bacterium]|nr:NAD(P)/FAD-dependent oxidoreductase [Chloroflexota bacterium]
MIVDCAIIGGGPAGLNAALVLGRARRTVLMFDDNQPRNAVTQESHGFLTRDGVKPDEFRDLAHQDIRKYPSVEIRHTRITDVRNQESLFELVADNSAVVQARTIILATGLKETLPAIAGIHDYYGRSLFSCPYCDGWELKDKPLIVIAEEGERAFHIAKLVWNWSRDVLVCTNGHTVLTQEQKEMLQKKEIQVVEDSITALVGKNGMLERVVFASHEESQRQGGFVIPQWSQASGFGALLGCDLNAQGGIVTDNLGRTTVKGVYAAGEVSGITSNLIVSAAQGSMAAAGVNMDLTQSEFL